MLVALPVVKFFFLPVPTRHLIVQTPVASPTSKQPGLSLCQVAIPPNSWLEQCHPLVRLLY